MSERNEYLSNYQLSTSIDLYRGVSGWFRRKLDKKAIQLGQKGRHSLFIPRVLDLFNFKILNEDIQILEIGCGNGWAISYKEPKVHYIAIDYSSVYKKDLESNGITFYEADVSVEKLTLADKSVDLIILNHIIEHISQIDFFVRELKRVLKKNGLVYIRTPDIEKVKWVFWHDYTHIRPFSTSSLGHLMSSFGFKQKFLLQSNHSLINWDILTNGKFRKIIFSRIFSGKEIEAGYEL